jgi:exopolyphosphatase/guanosine-5'-triphosphate,3'-diphosphate pyrophosphatase
MSVVESQSGIGLDLGGGSCQIFTFENKKLKESISLPIGSLKMYEKFAKENNIESAVYEYTSNMLSCHSEFHNVGGSVIYAIGGTARCAEKVCAHLENSKKNGYISLEDIDALLLEENREKAREIIKALSPERIDSLFSGCAVLSAICRYTGTRGIQIVEAGVREGFLYSVLLGKE